MKLSQVNNREAKKMKKAKIYGIILLSIMLIWEGYDEKYG